MVRWLRGIGAAAAVTVALVAAAPSLSAQVSVDDRISTLQELVKKKSDDQAAVVVDGLGQAYAGMSDEDKKKSVAALEKCLSAHRDDGDDKLFQTVVTAFANFGELGQKATLKSFKLANVDKRPGVLSAAVRSLGLHKNPANVKALVDFLVNNEPLVVAAAADALGNYAEAPEKTRKPIVEELVKNYAQFGSAAANTQANNRDKATAAQRLATVEKSFKDALLKLTGQEFANFTAAQKWFNDNKGKKWPEPGAAGGGS